ncbi:MAG: 50S ribosomal protein L13 [Parcubacteria group bacterium GW2011_GWA2_51_10]|nr:MAG: 50S ribosomal protein L13 [Parcubacteria group bacterium GW2011_GWA2_51_10]
MDAKVHTIDAAGKSLGRVASHAAKILMGKTSVSYAPNVDSAPQVKIVNSKKLSVSERKRLGKRYTSYSGYPGGLKTESLSQLLAHKGESEALRRAVERMLPRNSLRKSRMKKLKIVS